jgi:hypothetical protein
MLLFYQIDELVTVTYLLLVVVMLIVVGFVSYSPLYLIKYPLTDSFNGIDQQILAVVCCTKIDAIIGTINE